MALTKVFEDFFTEATDTGIESHTPDTGTAWVLLAGNPGTNMAVDGPTDTVVQPYHTGSGWNYAKISVTESQNDNQKAVMPLGQTGSASPEKQAVCVQLQDDGTDQDGYRLTISGGGSFQLNRIDSGSPTLLDSAALATPSSGDILELEIDSSGNLTGRYNGTDHLSATDMTHTGGYPGMAFLKSFAENGPTYFEGWMEAGAADVLMAQALL